jgi:tetratricopeptide (TPR) repeat protein
MRVLGSSRTLQQQSIQESQQRLSRNVRVFISSTFLDMYAEREELAKRVFPQLRDFCNGRQVTLTEVDLRWGIPQEEVDAGKVLPICLTEVANCHPFFVCLIGERYGEILGEIPAELLQSEPWLKDYPRKSITELEILHGALNPELKSGHAFFYMRSPGHSGVQSNPVVHSDIDPDDKESKSKLEDLKKRILSSGLPVREYTTPSHLGNLLLNDLKALFEQLFPVVELLSPLEQETAAHDAFAEKRSHAYVGPQRYFDRLDEHIVSRKPPLIVTGGTGLGKSSLLANWARRCLGYPLQLQPSASISDRIRGKVRRFIRPSPLQSGAPDVYLLAHFIGASAESSDWTTMLRRLMENMREHFNLALDIPLRAQALPAAFANYLQAVSQRGSLILILDGIDQLLDGEEILKLAWLPSAFPTNIRLILSAMNGETVDELRKRRWQVMEVTPLRSAEREIFIAHYLAQYRKTLNRNLLDRVASEDRAGNPLYLRTVLEELRLFGRHMNLPEHVEYLLAAESTEGLFGRILARLEADYVSPAPYRPELVRNTLRLIWAARQGLSESELVDLLGTADGQLPSALWSPFYLAVKESLLNRSGLFSFFHDDFRRAVEKRYLPGDDEKRAAHRELADYFIRSGSLHRRIVELPWHLAATGAWSELFDLLAEPEFLSAAWPAYQFDLKSFWARIETCSPLRMLNAFAPVIAAPTEYKNCLLAVCTLLSDAGHVAEALALSIYLEQAARESGDIAGLQVSLSLRAVFLKRSGSFNEALLLLREQEQICRRLGNHAALAASLGNQGVILRELGQLDDALSIHKLEESLCRRLQDLAGLSASLGNQGVILEANNDLPAALKLLCEQERICRLLGDLAGLQKSLGNQGLILWKAGETEKALNLLEEDEGLCRRLGDRSALHVCLGNQAMTLGSTGDYDRALDLYRQKESICREIGDMLGLVSALWLQARLFSDKLRHPDFALPLAREAQRVARRSGLIQIAQEIEEFLLSLNQRGIRLK